MVREARFCWEDADDVDLPDRRDRLGLDDDLFGPLPPDDEDRTAHRRKRREPGHGPRPARRDDRRHLAGADWMNEEVQP